jgi:Putative peptidoglycan binding domain
MRLFFVLVCCLAIPLVARAADQGNNNNKNNKKQTTQGQQPQAVSQGTHNGANTASQLNNPSHVKSQGQHRGLNAQNNNAPAVQSSTKGKVETKHNRANTASRNPSHLKGQHKGLNAQNNNMPAVKSSTKGKVETKRNGANTASQLNNSSKLKGQGQNKGLNAQNNNVPAVQSSTKGKVEARHFNLANTPNPKIQSTTFQQNYRIQGSQNWQGQNYAAFQNYRGEWHDQGWWNNRYDRIVLISGGWYFWNAGYWSPAWGYDSAFSYYPYNGPIYAYNNLPPDQVIANVQSTLQAQGYYQGEVDGTLGPITREALANYQRDHSLYTTEAIDEPTLASLGLS